MAKLFLVRHGQSLWNLENRFTGLHDVDLTPLGIAEAKHAGYLLSEESLQIAFTSRLNRAQHTLNIILDVTGNAEIPIIIDPALNERGYGKLEGLNKEETAILYGEEQVWQWRRSYDSRPPGGESLQDTFERVVPYFINFILPQLQLGRNVLIVAHGNSLRALIMHLEKLSVSAIIDREIPTGIPSCYRFMMDASFLQVPIVFPRESKNSFSP